jgi:epoxyqueuosine reductase
MTAPTGLKIEGEQRERLRQRLRDLGFDEVRFAQVGHEAGQGLRDWLANGMHADMGWMERTADKRAKVDLVLPGAKSVIILGVNYWRGASAEERVSGDEKPQWARYALHEDYHDTIKPGLIAAGRVLEEMAGVGERDYRYYVDTGPVLERGWAARSGLGFRGKNAMLISKTHGNWLFLASILTRIEIMPDEPLRKNVVPLEEGERAGLLCGKCTRCLDACPTDAFAAPGVVDARRCIS